MLLEMQSLVIATFACDKLQTTLPHSNAFVLNIICSNIFINTLLNEFMNKINLLNATNIK